MGEVERTRRSVVITKRGRPVARLVPADAGEPDALFGRLARKTRSVSNITVPLDPPRAVSWSSFEALFRARPRWRSRRQPLATRRSPTVARS